MSPAIATHRAEPIPSSRLLLSGYFYLQVLDLMTTAVFLASGIEEANPFLGLLMESGASPLIGLLCGKMLGALLGFYCWHTERYKLLYRANLFFGLLIVWNLFAMMLRAYGGH
jgi:hypothetical protein